MPSVPWKVRLSCCGLVLVAGGSLVGASHPAPQPLAVEEMSIHEEPVERVPVTPLEPEPIEDLAPVAARDVTGSRYPSGLTIRGASKHRAILFSFDDGPSRRTTPRLLDLLDQLGIKAVFFVSTESFGRGNPWEREHAEIVREIARRGHMIGNHTQTHRQLPLLRNAEIEAELAFSERKIEEVVGRRPSLIRPPGGALSARVERLLAGRGYTSVLWTLYAGDLEVDTPEQVVRTFFRVLKRRERETGDRGGIVLLHDTKAHSLEALPRLVAALKRRNCELLSQGEELYDIVGDLGYFIPGHTPTMPLGERQTELRSRTQRDCAALALR